MHTYTPSFKDRLLKIIEARRNNPPKKHEIARLLELKTPHERAELRALLYDLENQGRLIRLRGNRWTQPNVPHRVTGILRAHPNRFGLVSPDADQPITEDIFIREEGLFTALDGDHVLVELGRSGQKLSRLSSPTGRIVRVIQRNRTQIVGLLCKTQWYWYVVPDSPRLIHNVQVQIPDKALAKEGHKVVARLFEWLHPKEPLRGEVIEDLGKVGGAAVDVLSIIRDHHIAPDFPPEVEAEVERLYHSHFDDELGRRADFRSRVVFTIDPTDAKDCDDAVSLEVVGSHRFILGVHIADVAYYVRPNTSLDREAFLRGNSVYLVDRTIPMLPPRLSADLCSLHPGCDRLTHTVEMTFDADGRLCSSRTFPSVIRSAARLNYDQVQRFFCGSADADIPEPIAATLCQMRTLASLLRRRRMADGSLDLWMPEVRCLLDENGVPVDLIQRGANEAYQLIEEFMLAANRIVAGLLAERMIPAIYRIHPPPGKRQWDWMERDLNALGIKLKDRSRTALNDIARRFASSESAHIVHLAILRNLKRALYSPVLTEHFGLAFDRYTHFTSPIRRYPDLVVHRLLYAIERNEPPPITPAEATRICEHCSWTERNADDAEEESVALKRLEYFAHQLEMGETGPYDGVVVNLTPKGLIVELRDSLLRGLVPFRSMGHDYFVLDEAGGFARGRRTRETWKLGTPIRVEVVRIDRTRRQVDFALAGARSNTSHIPPTRKRGNRSRH